MQTFETALIIVGIPGAVIGLLICVFLARRTAGGWRYRPGRPFLFTPVWLGQATDEGQPPDDCDTRVPGPQSMTGGASVRW